jgi:hypothetical protein
VSGSRLLVAAVAALPLLAGLCSAPAALAAWSAAGTSGQAAVKARTMPTGATPTTSRSNRNVAVTWAQSKFTSGPAVGGYVVKRYDNTGVLQSIAGACDVTIIVLTCTEAAVPAGTWRYSVTPRQGLWSGTEGAQSTAVTVPAPTLTLSPTTVGATPATLTGSIANFITGQTVTYRLDNQTTGTVLTLPAGTTSGSHTVYAIGSSGDVASRAVTVGPAYVKNVGSASCGTTSLAVTVPAAGVAAGNTLILRLALRGTTAGTIAATDTKGNAYSVDQDLLNGDQRVAILRARATTALVSGNTINVTFPTATGSGAVVGEFTRLDANPVDASVKASGTGKAPTASVTTTAASDMLVGSVSVSGSMSGTQPSGWTALTAQGLTCGPLSNIGGYRIVDTIGTYSYAPTVPTSGTWAEAVVAYKAG